MPYFSFTLNQSFKDSEITKIISKYGLKTNKKYFSKNTNLWKIFNKKKNLQCLKNIKYEKRNQYLSGTESVLFLMPPSIGLGDSIEYAISIKSIINSRIFKKVGVCFAEKYNKIFSKIFKIQNVFDYVISEEELNKFILKPSSYAPGTKMNYSGLASRTDRANLIGYLKTFSD